jgi:hypothetical protein
MAAWFQTFAHEGASLQITSATISSSSLSVAAKDTGSQTANVTLAVVTPVSALDKGVIPGSFQSSAVFIVGPSGSLQASASLLNQLSADGSGLSIASSSSATLTYSCSVQFGAVLVVTTGQSYQITVIGPNVISTTTVTAS